MAQDHPQHSQLMQVWVYGHRHRLLCACCVAAPRLAMLPIAAYQLPPPLPRMLEQLLAVISIACKVGATV